MTLFHGGLVAVEEPQIMSRVSYRPLDFGTGFYTTTSYDQASRWVRNRLDRDTFAQSGFVTSYEFDEAAFAAAGLTRLDFPCNPVTVARLKPYRLAGQVLFHTERSLSFLKKVSTAEVPR